MDSSNKRMRLRAAMIAGALALSMAVPLAVSADTTDGGTIPPPASNGVTITGSSFHIDSKLIVTTNVSFTCDPIQVYDWETGTYSTTTAGRLGGASAIVVQASGRSVASSSGSVGGGAVVCDGTSTNTASIAVVATTAPWKSGAAAGGVTAFVDAGDEENGFGYGSTGPMVIRLAK
jgi:hypothetical protein